MPSHYDPPEPITTKMKKPSISGPTGSLLTCFCELWEEALKIGSNLESALDVAFTRSCILYYLLGLVRDTALMDALVELAALGIGHTLGDSLQENGRFVAHCLSPKSTLQICEPTRAEQTSSR